LVFPPPRTAREKPRPSIVPYLTFIDTTLKKLDAELTQSPLLTPYIDRVTRILERLEQREARESRLIQAAPVSTPSAGITTSPAAPFDVTAPLVRERDTLHQYFRKTDSPPSYDTDSEGGATAVHTTAKPACQDTPPTGDGPPRRWFHTAAGEYIDLALLGPVDWNLATTNLAKSVALLQPPFRADQTARAEEIPAPPVDKPYSVDHDTYEKDRAWYPTGTAGDIQGGEHTPQLEGEHTEGGVSGVQPAYDWRTDTSRRNSTAPYGRPRQGDTYTRDGDTYHTVGDSPTIQPIELLSRWLERLPGQLNGTHRSSAHDDDVSNMNYSRPVVIPHHNRWERAAAQYAAMDIYRDGVIRISTPSARRDSRIVPYRADHRSDVYDGGGARLSTYTPNPHDQQPARRFDIRIDRYTLPTVPESERDGVYESGGRSPSLDTDSYHDLSAAQSSDSVDHTQ